MDVPNKSTRNALIATLIGFLCLQLEDVFACVVRTDKSGLKLIQRAVSVLKTAPIRRLNDVQNKLLMRRNDS